MAGHECYHCKQWVEEGEAHDCWTTTESALTRELSEDLQDAYERLRETVVEFGEQRIYASHSSIMFARKACYFFVRPKRRFLEICIFLPRTVLAPQVRKTMAASKVKVAHLLQIRHRDEVEPPITEWLREAYSLEDASRSAKPAGHTSSKPERAARSSRSNARVKLTAKRKSGSRKQVVAKRQKRPVRRRT